MEPGLTIILVAAAVFFFAAFVHGSIGFGFPIIATPLIALVTDVQTAILLTLVPTLLVNTVSIVSEGSFSAALRRHLSLALLAMAGSAIGTLILIFTHSWIFEVLLAFAILAYLFSERLKLSLAWVHNYPRPAKLIFGTLAGIMGGLTNVMGPVLIVYSMESKYTKSDLIQALNTCFMLGKVMQIILFSAHGEFNPGVLSISAVMLVVVSLALYFGVNIKKRIDATLYTKVLRVFLFIVSATLIIKVVAMRV